MKRLKELLIPAILAVAFIFLTAVVAGGGYGPGFLVEFCFLFHLYPFGIGFAGADTSFILPYYIALWVVLTLVFLGIRRLIALIFKRSP